MTDATLLKEAEEELRRAHRAVLHTLTAAIDARDPYTHGHSNRVAEYTVAIARQMGLSPQDIERLRYAALLHDIGKLGVDDRVLRKRGPLNAAERAAMMEHPVIGAQLLEKAGVFEEVMAGVRHHHEWYNGGGYPDGLAGEAIPLDARIIGVADAFDAMTSDRPYRPALSPAQALAQLQEGQGVQFDPIVVEAFARAFEVGEIEAAARVAPPVPAPPSEEAVPVPQVAPALAPGVIQPVHHKEVALLYRIIHETDVRTPFPQVLHGILRICAEIIGEYTYMVYLWDDGTGALRLAAADGPGGQAVVPERLEYGVTVPEHVARTDQPLVVSGQESPPGPAPVLPTSHAACAIPIRYGGSTSGVLAVESPLLGGIGADEMYLLDSVRHVLGIAVWLGRHQEQLAHAASHDGLTGLLNHSAFYDRLGTTLESARRTGEPVAVVLLDVDGLKAVNDAQGHLAGDEALRQWAELLRTHVPPGGQVARYGGDEFALILPGMGREEAADLMERIDRAARRTFRVGKRNVRLPHASVGLAVFPEDGGTPRELVGQADRFLYHRKGTRRASRLGPGLTPFIGA
ncbi:sensor domain-containing diguanylate cyclase/phosphohydrolase [Caldinitratiruptor microaerophilus]|uniref:sensor domain-containing diguanylate cyclase/phosphohydrolase n=1 Tax=Caldinitratiruptor microaerophilus TaxID=671077 RepID=UPI002231E354|nr:HD domain-containing phosphohydrolase [Caldinitratiruptor microaerophilus]